MVSVRLDQVASLFSEGIEAEPLSFGERRKRRQEVLRESLPDRLRRIASALAFAGAPRRVARLAAFAECMARDRIVAPLGPPDPRQASARPDGLCGLARALTPANVLEGYSLGLALFAPAGIATWWSPSRRWAVEPGALGRQSEQAFALLGRIGASAEMDRGFDETLAACARPEFGKRLGFGPKLRRVYADLYDAGLAHSIEIRSTDGRLAAGAFGLAIGRVFMTEACFGPYELVAAALVLLDRQLHIHGFVLHEAHLGPTPSATPARAFRTLGLEPLPRPDFLARLRANPCGLVPARWRLARRLEEERAAPPVREDASQAPLVRPSSPARSFASAA